MSEIIPQNNLPREERKGVRPGFSGMPSETNSLQGHVLVTPSATIDVTEGPIVGERPVLRVREVCTVNIIRYWQ